MQVNLFSRPLQSLNVQQQNDEAHNISLEKNLKTLDKAQAELSKIDKQIASLNKQPASVETLAMLAAHQRQVVLAMLGGNPEMAIAALLAQGIEECGKQLESIQAWTNGGEPMFLEALQFMLDDLLSGGLSNEEMEDALLLLVMDLQVNGNSWGLGSFMSDPKNNEFMLFIVELIGSANHMNATDGVHLEWDTPELTAGNIDTFLNSLINAASSGQIPTDSVTGLVLDQLSGQIDELCTQYVDHFNDSYGGIDSPEVSVIFRLYLLSIILADQSLTQDEVELILSGTHDELDDFFLQKTALEAFDYLVLNSSWANDWGQLYIPGGSVSLTEIQGLYANFPARELTKEELKEVNRIGDQIQMLQETLKYWLSIMRDEQLAAARNI
ncbi:TPA: hypothetical protein RSW71_003077 [Vibrio cholerae]|nr:hypothetical protein [Vibrio cholerae]HDZ3778146.1 hypothetical protein [Vibrio cholerae]